MRLAQILFWGGKGCRGLCRNIECDFWEQGRILRSLKDSGGNFLSRSLGTALAELGFPFRKVSDRISYPGSPRSCVGRTRTALSA